jgi:hypothetical protein
MFRRDILWIARKMKNGFNVPSERFVISIQAQCVPTEAKYHLVIFYPMPHLQHADLINIFLVIFFPGS